MRLDLFSKNDTVLLVGEGNLSFSVCLVEHQLPISITATCFEKEFSFEKQKTNLDYLRSKKIPVFFDVDATKLHLNGNFRNERFSKIVFNFPHVGGKMKIHLNRELLRKTFESCGRVIEEGGLMIVSLCQGQGGTPADRLQRRFDDSWQIAEMAAYGNFVLTGVEPFHGEFFEGYQCVGYRSQDVKFNLQGALVHIFIKVKPFITGTDDETLTKNLHFVPLSDTVSVPSIYSELYRSNPLLNVNSGISFLKELLLSDLNETLELECKVLTDDDVPTFVENKLGVPCVANGAANRYFLRRDSSQVIDYIFESLKITELNEQVILFPGAYFNDLGRNFADSPVQIEFLVLASKELVSFILKHFRNLFNLFNEENLICSLQPVIFHFPSSLDSMRIHSVTDVVCSSKETSEAFVAASVYSLERCGVSFEACILKPSLICKRFFKMNDWRELWSEHKVIVEATTGRPIVKQIMLYPSEYRFDVTLRFNTDTGFSEKKFYEILWLSGGGIIKEVVLMSEYDSKKGWSSKCFRITYKSLGRPVNRSRIIEFHSKTVGRMLELGMGVTVS